MSNTHRRSELDENFGCFEGYLERRVCFGPKVVDPASRDAYLSWEKKLWSKRNRDGTNDYYCRNRGSARKRYRTMTKKLIRSETRRKISLALRNDDWDDTVFPTHRDAKKFIWSVW